MCGPSVKMPTSHMGVPGFDIRLQLLTPASCWRRLCGAAGDGSHTWKVGTAAHRDTHLLVSHCWSSKTARRGLRKLTHRPVHHLNSHHITEHEAAENPFRPCYDSPTASQRRGSRGGGGKALQTNTGWGRKLPRTLRMTGTSVREEEECADS